MRIERQQHHFIASSPLQLGYSLRREWMPIAHRHETTSVDSLCFKRSFKGARLTFRKAPDGRAAPDYRIMVLDFFSAGGGDQLGERTAPDAGEREVNDVRVAKQVIKKRLDGFQRVGSAQLEQNYPQTPLGLRHPHRFPRMRPDVNSFQASASNLALQIRSRKTVADAYSNSIQFVDRQVMFDREHNQLHSGRDAGFVEDIAQVVLHGVLGNPEALGNLFICPS